MLIFIGEPHYKIITAEEGTGDNLLAEDIAEGLKDYWMSSMYEQDGEEIKLVDSAQIMTSKLIADMEEDEKLRHIMEYWEVGDPDDREADYVVLEH